MATNRKIVIPQPQKAIIEFLKKKGWDVLMTGKMAIEQRDPQRKALFTFTMEFVGRKRGEGKESRPSPEGEPSSSARKEGSLV